MLMDKDAQRIASAIEEHFATGSESVRATVETDRKSPGSIPAGAGRPTFINYYIHVEDGKRRAVLDLGQAGGVLNELEPDCDADRLFEAIRERDVPIEDIA